MFTFPSSGGSILVDCSAIAGSQPRPSSLQRNSYQLQQHCATCGWNEQAIAAAFLQTASHQPASEANNSNRLHAAGGAHHLPLASPALLLLAAPRETSANLVDGRENGNLGCAAASN
jgi:hypothetical protein